LAIWGMWADRGRRAHANARQYKLHGMGPQGITYVNPADDPRKSN